MGQIYQHWHEDAIMADVFTKAKRSEVMSRIRGRGNKDTELALAKLLRANGISGWGRHAEILGRDAALRRPRTARRSVPTLKTGAHGGPSRTGKVRPTFRVRPDFVFKQVRLALFVDGCFWHGCPKHATKPKNNRAFWRRKLSSNKQRDQIVIQMLRRAGWRVIRIWECALQRAIKQGRDTALRRSLQTPTSNEWTARRSVPTKKIPQLIRRIQRELNR
jgi:DNA mismatch endonuclease (patch repair protein)